jgi:hypothetical protein
MLLELVEFISREKTVSTQQLVREFRVDKEALLPMLHWWVRKGKIRLCERKASCKSSCFRCKPESFEYYQWVQ